MGEAQNSHTFLERGKALLFRKRLDLQDFANALIATHESFFSAKALSSLADKLTLAIEPARMPLARMEWTIFGIYAVAKAIEENVQDATVRHCVFTSFLAKMHAHISGEADEQPLDRATLTSDRLAEYNAAWHRFPDSRPVQELGEAISRRVLGMSMRDNLLALPFGQLTVAAMNQTAKFVKDVLSTVKLKI